MRFILSVFALSAITLSVLTACQPASTANRTVSTNPVKTTATQTKTAQTSHDHDADQNAPRITLADAKKDFDANAVIFVDTRGADSYLAEHIKGAINVPANAPDAKLSEIPTGKKIVAYCS